MEIRSNLMKIRIFIDFQDRLYYICKILMTHLVLKFVINI